MRAKQHTIGTNSCSGWAGSFAAEGPLDTLGLAQGHIQVFVFELNSFTVFQKIACVAGGDLNGPEGQEVDAEEGGSVGDTDCHDTHPNADSFKLR